MTTKEQVDVAEPSILIRVPKAFRPGMSDLALYEATRGVWRIGPRREGAEYAVAVVAGVVQEVFEIQRWQPALTSSYATRRLDRKLARGRWEFVGRRASEGVRRKYLRKSVAHYFKKGAQNPITYVNVPVEQRR